MSVLRGVFFAVTLLLSIISTTCYAGDVETRRYHPPVCEEDINDIAPLDENGNVFLILRCERHYFSPWRIPLELLQQFEDLEMAVDKELQVLYRWVVVLSNHRKENVYIYTPYGVDVIVDGRTMVEMKFLALPGVRYEANNFFLTLTPRADESEYTITTFEEGIPTPEGRAFFVTERISKVN